MGDITKKFLKSTIMGGYVLFPMVVHASSNDLSQTMIDDLHRAIEYQLDLFSKRYPVCQLLIKMDPQNKGSITGIRFTFGQSIYPKNKTITKDYTIKDFIDYWETTLFVDKLNTHNPSTPVVIPSPKSAFTYYNRKNQYDGADSFEKMMKYLRSKYYNTYYERHNINPSDVAPLPPKKIVATFKPLG